MTHSGKVLVIDIDSERATALAALVGAAGFSAATAEDTAPGTINLSESSELDVILSDLDTEGSHWGDASRSLKDMNVAVPVIMFSDEASSDNMMRALRLGASDFFQRPVDQPEDLFRSMERCVRQREMSRELRHSRRRLVRANRELNNTVRVLQQDQQAGRQVQLRMLPATPMSLGDYVFSHAVIPSLYLSGDFTDYFTVGEHCVVFFMADVSGHGSSSAFATVLLKNLFARKRSDFLRRNDRTVLSPVDMLGLANKELLDLGADKFATMIVAVLDTQANRLAYSVAGHLPLPVLVSAEGATYLEGEGSPVGMLKEAEFSEHSLDLPQEFLLALFSDGILEILPPQNLIEKERYFLDIFSSGDRSSAALMARLGLDTVKDAPDDIAALFVSRKV
jgi:serine phosphatase RsbU (regulator of sigma subunit)